MSKARQAKALIKYLFTPISPPPTPEYIVLPPYDASTHPFFALEEIVRRWKLACPGPLQDGGRPCSEVSCPYKVSTKDGVDGCSFWQAIKSEVGQFSLDEAQRVQAEYQYKVLQKLMDVERAVNMHYSNQNLLRVILVTQLLPWFVSYVMALLGV